MEQRAIGVWDVVAVAAALAGIGMCVSAAHAFTVKANREAPSHEVITVVAARAAGITEPARDEVTRSAAACDGCETFGTKSFKTFSAVVGNRFAELHGWSLSQESACFAATTQESEAAQHTHFLRGHCDSGPGGLRRAVNGATARIAKWFEHAVLAGDELTWVNDGGASVTRLRVSRPYFFLGLALHTLQDSFSDEHTDRDRGFRRIRDVKSFVETPGAQSHYKAPPPLPDDAPAALKALRLRAQEHGDHAFVGKAAAPSELKANAQAAAAASADLIRAFDAARKAPRTTHELFRAFARRWLALLPSHVALAGKNAAPWCEGKDKAIEVKRAMCIAKVGAEPFDHGGPRFCWPAGTCGEGAGGGTVARGRSKR